MRRERRDKNGRVKDSLLQRFRSWRLAKKLRKGKIPRGRTISSAEAAEALAGTCRGVMIEGFGLLSAKVLRGCEFGPDGQPINWDREEDLGLISCQKITTAFRDYLVDSLQDATTNPLDVFDYHGCGTGTTAEANTDTALGTEVGSRVQGTKTEGTTSDIYKTVATLTPGGTYAITEHGVFSASTGGTLMDRSVFSAINVTASDSIQFTYEATFNAEA